MTEVAAGPKDSYPVRWAGRQAIMTLPEHIDASNAGQIREELLSVINRRCSAYRRAGVLPTGPECRDLWS